MKRAETSLLQFLVSSRLLLMMQIRYASPLLLLVLVFLAGCAGSRSASQSTYEHDPNVVAVIDGRPISVAEFERRYAKSVGGEDQARLDSLGAYREFLDRYVDFRLKVLAGIDAGLPDDPELSREIEEYRRSYARPYLLEQEVLSPIIREIYERQKEMVKARHILLQVDEGASPSDTLAAYQRLAAIVDSVEAGADFGEMAVRHSEDPSAQRPEGAPGARGDLGFFSAGQMVEPFETYAYETEVGSMSPIFRTQFGYHVLQVQDRIQTPPPVRVAHIMIDASQVRGTRDDAKALADSLAERIHSGEDFAELVAEHSHDINTVPRGGELGVLQYNTPVVQSFKDAAFAIEEVGGISDPVETQFGYHIIKLLERQDLPTYDEVYESMKQRVARMPRVKEAEGALALQIRNESGARIDTTALFAVAGGVSPDEFMRLIHTDSLDAAVMQRSVAYMGDEAIAFEDLAEEIRTGRAGEAPNLEALLLAAADRVLSDRALDYGSRALERRDQEFGELMQEFRDGLILFRFMEDSVWTAASRDTSALEAIYNTNPSAYRYPDRTRIISVSSVRDSTINAFTEAFDVSGLAAALDGAEGLRVDTTLITGPTNSYFDAALELAQGARTDASRQSGRHTVLINDGIEPARTKTFEEARPELVSIYQDRLEKQILADLRRRYHVETYPQRLDAAFRTEVVSQLQSGE